MDQAVDLVIAALTQMDGGEVFVPIIRSARMVDLAWAVAHVPVENIGIRPGEKLHETLVTQDEMSVTEDDGDLLIIRPGTAPRRQLERGSYRSDTGPFLTVEELQAMIA
jgi:UDP-N-acetylglucosamine 4,6-dehydratase